MMKASRKCVLTQNKNEKSEDYSKADLKQRVLFFYNNISAGHTSLLQVYRCYKKHFIIERTKILFPGFSVFMIMMTSLFWFLS